MEHLERTRLVAHIENELERMISRGPLPKGGNLPSEHRLAQSFGVARGTIREALLRLAARGLISRRQGRQARVVAIGRAVTLEHLGVALHGLEGEHAGRLRLLEGYFALKRETTVELLVRSCEQGSDENFERLETACFALQDGTRWDDGTKRWVEQEFELLRTAAVAAERPGHFLLVQSLERAYWGMAELVRPLLNAHAVHHWSERTLGWLFDRDVEALRRELPPLLRACDEHISRSLGPVSQKTDRADASHRASAVTPQA